jgi:DNA-binding transcriptional ArsR family regulator
LRNSKVAYIFATCRLLIKRYKMKQDIFQAIADPTRRAILTLIAIQALTPNVMAEKFDMSRQAVSKHIKVLHECELIKPEQSGREIYYHFNAKKMQEFDNWLAQFRQNLETQFNQLDKVLSTIKEQKK